MIQTLIIGTLLAVGAGTVASAADAPDPIVGTWKLNVDKSKYDPGPGPKSQTRTYAQTADGIALTFKGVSSDGTPMTGESTFKYDGKDYPITGSPDYDTLTLKRVNANTVKSSQKLAGKVVGTTVRTVSADGKTMTLTSKGTDSKGVKFNNKGVFDKQ
jgi:hypothetical protein